MKRKSPLVLIADDDNTARMILKLLLKKDHYQVAEVTNGQECLDAFNILKPDLILLDAIMPVMDGFECCRQLQTLSHGSQTPILIITGLDDQKSVNRAFAVGAIDYINKPIHPPLLRQRLKRILQVKKAEAALKESEKKYKYLVNNLKEIIFQTDINGKLIFLNPAWKNVTGFTIAESLGQNIQDFISPDDYALHKKNFSFLTNDKSINSLDENLQSQSYQLKMIKKNKAFCWVDIYAYLVVNSDNIIISGTINDITERKNREKYFQIENEVRKILAEAHNLQDTTLKSLTIIGHYLGWQWGEIWFGDLSNNQIKCMTIWEEDTLREKTSDVLIDNFYQVTKESIFSCQEGLISQILPNFNPIWLNDLTEAQQIVRLKEIEKIGFQTILGFPLTVGEKKVGSIIFFSLEKREIETETINFLNSLGSQIGQFICRKIAEEELKKRNEILQSELNKAANYVRSLLPSPLREKVSINQQFIPSLQLGGDAFDYYWLDKDNLLIYLLDVAGHGIQSALLSVSLVNLMRSQSLYNTDFYQPWTVLEELNRMFPMDNHGQSYFTIWYGIYNVNNRELIYACGGHPPALLISADGRCKKIGTISMPVGMFAETEFEDQLCHISPGSTLYVFSDGIYEIYLDNQQIWGIDAFINLIVQEHQVHGNVELNLLIEKIQNITQTQVFGDDLSILQIKF